MKPDITVASLSSAIRIKRRFSAVLTVEDPGLRNGLRFHKTPHPDQLVLRFEDVDFEAPGVALPDPKHVEAAIDFGREHSGKPILVHCKAGVARSTALALALIADLVPDEDEAVRMMLEIRPIAVPNLLVLSMADAALGRGGRLMDAWMKVENSDRTYAEHRRLKRQTLERSPSLYAPPLPFFALTGFRFAPDSLARSPVFPETEPCPAR